MSKNDLVTIRRFSDENEARIFKSVLESGGFDCYLTNEFTSLVLPAGSYTVCLCVRQADAQRAEEFLEAQPE